MRPKKNCPGPVCQKKSVISACMPLCRLCWSRLSRGAKKGLWAAQRAPEKPSGVPVLTWEVEHELAQWAKENRHKLGPS